MTTDYDAIDAINISTLKAAWRSSPLHYRHGLDHPREATAQMELGTAAHCMVLEPARYLERYIVRPAGLDGRTKDGKAWAAEAASSGRIILSAADHDLVMGMANAVKDHPFASKLLGQNGRAEHVITWTDAETGLDCKGRLDLLTDSGELGGLKTARDVGERRYYAQAAQLGYHLQWAFYYDGLCALGQKPRCVWEVAVESAPPHDVAVDYIDDETIEAGREAYRAALRLVAQCRKANDWPGQAPKPRQFRLPEWAMGAELDWGEENAA